MFSYWAYILVGNNNTGKTTFQRKLVKYLCNKDISRLKKNFPHAITHPNAPKDFYNLFTMNRSFQEIRQYKSVPNYFSNYFYESDICLLSSHLDIDVINEMIDHLHGYYYNVAGIFWSNNINKTTKKISSDLNWDERLWFYNKKTSDKNKQQKQIDTLAFNFANFILKRSFIQ